MFDFFPHPHGPEILLYVHDLTQNIINNSPGLK